ncbi:asparagine synthase (glutamine-hydrolysing) [Arcticibacter pallidicorallinus]|uniref:asparagine synthase (glutamine-hydrolyzing) n=1 Tax=Arcticibacter pallidicorallinus TaxID=1259464 RepID=A0A2T0TRK1_9SPHI|nr:asparagine synthase (glutamine-hydrolyzing) [Arcticibacter pallidicorallinus]PRY48310.1 asparagine synthase (glutamine-hydrolysing) [Arcticibacter pallidicorallinus]
MCGIYGSTIKYGEDVLREKLNKASFRGPDFSALWDCEDVVLGHNRLAIIDLDSRSNQPFLYKHLAIVFNGEIYNFLELKAELQQKGYSFNTSSDTEVICAAYLEYGASCVQKFNGMFAFTIYDSRERVLFGARDRLGKKPFYYSHSGTEFEFASQPSQIALFNDFTVNQQAIREYLIWGYVPEPRSIWTEVKKLPAGYSFTFNCYTGVLKTEKYWDLDYSWANKFQGSFDAAKIELKGLLTDAVKIRMNADVPLGIFLSGGIDSSLIAALASQMRDSVKTFSIKFNEKDFDESKYASMVASHLGTEHHTIECSYDSGLDLIENFSRYYDEPFADSSAIPSLLLSKYTKNHVTVALSGDGGDEGFIGYTRYKWINNVSPIFGLPLSIRQSLAACVNLSPNYVHKLIGMGISLRDIEILYVKMFGGMENSWVQEPDLGLNNPFREILTNKRKNLLENLSDFDIKTYLNEDINTKVDRASMAFSLESRSPLMDYRVMEFSRNLPTRYKYYRGSQKRILKDILFEYVPAQFFNRPKAGFTMPFKEWFRDELKEYVLDNLSEKELQSIPGINVKRTLEIIKEHMTGKWNRYPQIWKLLVLQQWLKAYDNKALASLSHVI